MRTIERMVEQEIICNVSHLVATLANGAYALPSKRHGLTDGADDLGALAEQASDLAAPVDDWEEAAMQAGWSYSPQCWTRPDADADGGSMACATAEQACAIDDVEAYQREVFEHWFVTDWFADRLDAKGEKVDKDFAGHCVWARTTTGQGIASDSVIQAIHADLVREYGE